MTHDHGKPVGGRGELPSREMNVSAAGTEASAKERATYVMLHCQTRA
jgi:hypothetical protein